MRIKLFISAVVSAFVLLTVPTFSQDDDFENYSFDDEQVSNQKQPYFALSVGGTVSLLFMNYDDINSKPFVYNSGNISSWKDFWDEEFSGPMITVGFNLFSAMSPLVNNARLGISYQSGSKELEKLKDFPMVLQSGVVVAAPFNVYRKLSVQTGGLHFDYAIVPMKSLAILAGAGFKVGLMTLEQFFTFNDSRMYYQNDWDNQSFLYTVTGTNEQLKYRYFTVEPQISIEYALTGFLMLKAGGSYMLTVDNPLYKNAWTNNGNNVYKNVPKSVKPQGFSINLGLYIGLFNY